MSYKVVIDYSYTKPPTYKIAFQYPKWCETMDVEFQALQKQDTQATHGQLIDELLSEIAALRADFAKYRSAFPPPPPSDP
nr:hypothetical protein CFP56_29266 [Quercus suber]